MQETRCDAPKGWTLFQCTHGSRVWLPMRCRHCTGCDNARRNRTIAKILGGLIDQPRVGLLTLTTTPGTDWKTIMRKWSSMARWIRRTSPQMSYACLKEEGTATGMRHLHILMRNFNFTPQAEVSQEWSRLVGAWIVDVRRVDGPRSAAYVAKYVAKGGPDLRKVATYGRGWPTLPPLPQVSQAIGHCGPWGPSVFTLVTDQSGLVESIAPDCSCWGRTAPPPGGLRQWLKSQTDRLSPAYRANSAR